MGYVAHTSSGHLKLMLDRQPISELVHDESLDSEQAEKFENILRIREFASDHLHLPENKSYTSYVALERDYVTWVVFAAPEYSLQAKNWCFWIVGCVPYRGYFDKSLAEKFANELKQQALETYIAPVPAYSTLGWFSDPVLSSMTDRGEVVTAEYIFHELAHQKVYIKNDAGFNEAFATAVAEIGVMDWLESEDKSSQKKQFLQTKQEKRQLYPIVNDLRHKLGEVYELTVDNAEKERLKQSVLSQYKQQIENMTIQQDQYKRYKSWLLTDMNNAKLNAFSTYQNLVPGFVALFKACGKNFPSFYKVVESAKRLDKAQRRAMLKDPQCVVID